MPGFETIGEEEKAAVMEIFDNGDDFYIGARVRKFQSDFASFVGMKYTQSYTSCTAALKGSIKALDLNPSDEIITSCFTYVATAEGIIEAGGSPVFTEIDNTYNMDHSDLESKINENTKGIVPVHMYGAPADMNPIMEIAKKHGITVIEDAAQGFGSKYGGKLSGTLSDLGCFSFDSGKLLNTGEGGMVATDNENLYRKVHEYFDHGHQNNPNFPRGRDTRVKPGFNFRLTEIAGALGIEQLKKVNMMVRNQQVNRDKILDGIKDCKKLLFREFAPTSEETGEAIVFSLPSVSDVKILYDKLVNAGIPTKNLPDAYDWHFAGTWDHIIPKHTPSWFNDSLASDKKSSGIYFPKSTDLLSRSIAIMVFVYMDDEKINKIINTIKEFDME